MLAYADAKTLQLKQEVTVGLCFTFSILHFYKLVYAIALYNLNIQNISICCYCKFILNSQNYHLFFIKEIQSTL